LLRSDEHRRRRVADLAGDRRGYATPVDEGRQAADLLQVRFSGALVAIQTVERADLGVEGAGGLGPQRSLMRFDGEGLHLLAGDVPFLRDHLGTAELADLTVAVALDPTGRGAERVGE